MSTTGAFTRCSDSRITFPSRKSTKTVAFKFFDNRNGSCDSAPSTSAWVRAHPQSFFSVGVARKPRGPHVSYSFSDVSPWNYNQNLRSDNPAKYPEGVRLLYMVYLCACLMERTWRFGLPLVLANLAGKLNTRIRQLKVQLIFIYNECL